MNMTKDDVARVMATWRARVTAERAALLKAEQERRVEVRTIHLPNPLLDAYVAQARSEKEGVG